MYSYSLFFIMLMYDEVFGFVQSHRELVGYGQYNNTPIVLQDGCSLLDFSL